MLFGIEPLQPGQPAPNFSLRAADGRLIKLSDYKNKKNVVLFFYPKDDSPGCTAEACTFRDRYDDFVEAGAEVIGISADSADSHQKFSTKHGLPMTLLTDEKGTIRKAYNVKDTFGLVPGRVTFLIDRKGIIRHVFSSQIRVHQHVEQALQVLRELQNNPSH